MGKTKGPGRFGPKGGGQVARPRGLDLELSVGAAAATLGAVMAKSGLLVVGVVACLVVGGLFLAGPYVALYQLRSAANQDDAQALSELVDFDQVRTHTKIRLRTNIERRVPAGFSGLARVGAAVAGAALDPLVDSVITPQTIASWVKESPSSPPGSQTKAQRVETKTHFVSLSQFEASVNNGAANVDLVFTRNVLRWRLSDIRFDLPLDKLMSQLGLPPLGGAAGGPR
jgi:hypothetical protein